MQVHASAHILHPHRWHIVLDLKMFADKITDRQALDVFQRQSSLSTRIILHRNRATLFLDILPETLQVSGSITEETDRWLELARLFLPSHLGCSLSPSGQSLRVKGLELKLQHVNCLCALCCVWATSIQKG
jgi:hypothetical protein